MASRLHCVLQHDPEIERNLKAKYHLDKPIHQQYLIWLSGVVRGDFGPSLQYRSHSVTDIIAEGLQDWQHNTVP